MSCRRAGGNPGFTVVELLITVPITALVISAIFGYLISIYGQLLVKDAQVSMALEVQNTLASLQDDLFFARNFAEKPNSAMVDAYGPGGSAAGWTFNTSPATLIVYQVALNKSYQAADRELIFQGQPPCDMTNPPLLVNLIYYVDSAKDLRRRVLAPDPVYPRCMEPFLQQTCPTSTTRQQQDTDTTTSTVACQADVTLAHGVSSLTIDYYDANDNLLNIAAGDTPLQAERVTLKITLTGTGFAKSANYSAELSIKKINRGDPNIQ